MHSKNNVHLSAFVSPVLDNPPKGIHLLVHQLLHTWVPDGGLSRSPTMKIFEIWRGHTSVTSRTSEVWGFTVPSSRWKRMACSRARRTSFAVCRSTTLGRVSDCLDRKEHTHNVDDNHRRLRAVAVHIAWLRRRLWAFGSPFPIPYIHYDSSDSRQHSNQGAIHAYSSKASFLSPPSC